MIWLDMIWPTHWDSVNNNVGHFVIILPLCCLYTFKRLEVMQYAVLNWVRSLLGFAIFFWWFIYSFRNLVITIYDTWIKFNISECKPIESIAFAKTHKTGSTTLQNIFLRYAYNHDLTLALPIQGTVNRVSWKLTTSFISEVF